MSQSQSRSSIVDEIALVRELAAGADTGPVDEEARDRARLALLERASPEAFGGRRAGRRSIRRPALAMAGALAAAAALAGAVVLSSGPTAQTASAEILHKTAAIAAATDAPAEVPGPGQFLYKRFKRVELESWEPGGESMGGGVMTRPGSFAALMPVTSQEWLAPDGDGRHREIAGTPRFLTSREEARWEAAGSRLPPPFDPEYQRRYLAQPAEFPPGFHERRKLAPGIVDRESTYSDGSRLKGFHFPDTTRLPTDPEALRQAVESNRFEVGGFNHMDPSAKRLGEAATIAQLLNILQEGYVATPELRAATFNALAELPGVHVDTDATDLLGRRGYSISRTEGDSGRIEYIFDPATAEILAERDVLCDPSGSPFLEGVPAGTTIRETAYLESGVVDSTDETSDGEPIATIEPRTP
jgi:hypothetical protein